jgi:succinoglycan biosynthesis protein ExoA
MPPVVSIIVPCYNEEGTIGLLLGAILHQTYSYRRLEVVIADGLSTDSTRRAIATFATQHPELALRVVDNEKQTIPAGLNAAIREARGEYIVRLDAHSIPEPTYVERCVQALEQDLGANVGGMWTIRAGANTAIARGIAAAAAHPLGAGDAAYRLGGRPAAVDTVPFGAFRRRLVTELGGFDESLLTNEDYEFNTRIRMSGGRVWFDPEIRSSYIARSSYRQLARQYWRYGYWKSRMLSRYPGTARYRQVLPPLFVLSLVVLSLAALFWMPAVYLVIVEVGAYAIALLVGAAQIAAASRDWSVFGTSLLSFAVMHTSWGAGFLWGSLNRDAVIRG